MKEESPVFDEEGFSRGPMDRWVNEFGEGKTVHSRVKNIRPEKGAVDVGVKKRGKVFAREFIGDSGSPSDSEEDFTDVNLEREPADGQPLHSREKARKIKRWEEIQKAWKEGRPIEGKITARVNGGFEVDIGVKAFLPGSQVDIYPTADPESRIGHTYQFQIIRMELQRENVVVSRRVILEKERLTRLRKKIEWLQEGQIVEGVVKNLKTYGAFLDVEGIDGFLHVSNISWTPIGDPSEALSLGTKIKVKVLQIEPGSHRISVGLKQTMPNPWENAARNYAPGTVVKGKIQKIADYGIFLRLEDGIYGLIHISNLPSRQNAGPPSEFYRPGDEIQAVILNTDPERRRISLGMKQLEKSPWEGVSKRYRIGQRVRGKVTNLVKFGAFVELDRGIEGLVHISELAFGRVEDPSEVVEVGDEVQAVVLSVNENQRRIALSMKDAISSVA